MSQRIAVKKSVCLFAGAEQDNRLAERPLDSRRSHIGGRRPLRRRDRHQQREDEESLCAAVLDTREVPRGIHAGWRENIQERQLAWRQADQVREQTPGTRSDSQGSRQSPRLHVPGNLIRDNSLRELSRFFLSEEPKQYNFSFFASASIFYKKYPAMQWRLGGDE